MSQSTNLSPAIVKRQPDTRAKQGAQRIALDPQRTFRPCELTNGSLVLSHPRDNVPDHKLPHCPVPLPTNRSGSRDLDWASGTNNNVQFTGTPSIWNRVVARIT